MMHQNILGVALLQRLANHGLDACDILHPVIREMISSFQAIGLVIAQPHLAMVGLLKQVLLIIVWRGPYIVFKGLLR